MSPTTHAFTLPAGGAEGARVAVLHRPAAGDPASARDPGRGGHRADGRHAPGVLFCGGFHSSMEGDKARFVAARCAAAGVACTRFDYRGHGASGGEARRLTLLDWLDDTVRVIDHLAAHARGDPETAAPLVIVGSSMGAWLAVRAALARPGRVRALLLIAAAPDFLQDTLLERLGPTARARLEAGSEVTLPSPYDETGWPITPALIDSGRTLSVLHAGAAGRVRCPVRMLHGERDDTAPLERARALCTLLGDGRATLSVVEGGDHRLSDPASLALLGRTLATLLGLAAEDAGGGRPGESGDGDGDRVRDDGTRRASGTP